MVRAVIFDMFETLITHFESPLYFGTQMAEDIGISEENFQSIWHPTEYDRTVGKVTLEEVLVKVMEENHIYSEDLLDKIVKKRIRAKEECFKHLHPEIISMLSTLKEKGYLIGLISNCFSEEAEVIRNSVLFPYFDVLCLSYEQGMQKPDEEIYQKCMKELAVKAEECLYVGDGGSNELEAAKKLGMKAVQAAWYLKQGTRQPTGRKPEFVQVETPLGVMKLLEEKGGI